MSLPGWPVRILVFRLHHPEAPRFAFAEASSDRAEREDILALSRTKADETVFNILQKPIDRQIAEQALFTARKPDQYHYCDQEECIQQILGAFAAAIPSPRSSGLVAGQEVTREHDQPPKRYGRPNALDHDYDKAHLFLPQMQDEVDVERKEIDSLYSHAPKSQFARRTCSHSASEIGAQ
ncbi:hypothetical protein HRG_007403 [Hirsutella rhossiliensis]|uniref:Uncharacterized protein n=1 Tax=Hirsutella rhossiliensis TaxID=111463 RepID=A0A9P8SHA3_9HYPO|nr:uncharacterized protein HRG_07403 [Hirsutella rhossiliensis]KAH0961325.1 hypothetical protein HRG_07403 [Hirsutella rhossiliensis]